MIGIDSVVVTDELISEQFVCNLDKCKGACCIEGDSGAPLNEDELGVLEEIYPKVKPYMTEKGIATIEKQGTWVMDVDGDLTTPCVDTNKECAYVIWEKGITQCAIEKAYNDGQISYQKPISCHLYPIRITKYPEFEVLKYDRWHICAPACTYGQSLKVPVYQFLKNPLIRKYGKDWYAALEAAVAERNVE